MSPSLYLSVLSSLSYIDTLNRAPDVRPFISSPLKKPNVVSPIPILEIDNIPELVISVLVQQYQDSLQVKM